MIKQIQQYLGKTVSLGINFLLIVFIVRFVIVEPGQVNGQSMEPNYHDNDIFLVNKLVYLLHEPQRFDIIQLYDTTSNQFFIKRIIGLPGETVIFKRNQVFIHTVAGEDIELAEPYLSADAITSVQPGLPHSIYIPPHRYYVLGDNRLFSNDSRVFGPVQRRNIIGQVVAFK